MDILSPEKRSALMGRIKGKNTGPEITVRRAAHKLGYRYRLHVASLPGRPDMVFPRLRKVIFVHGCFWHRHNCVQGRSMPRTNIAFWKAKFIENRKRDRKNRNRLRRLGWKVLILWECKCAKEQELNNLLRNFLEDDLTN